MVNLQVMANILFSLPEGMRSEDGHLLNTYYWVSLVAQMVKNPPAVQETWVQSLGLEDPLEEGMATHSSIPAWRMPVDRGAWRATVRRVTQSQRLLK